MPKIVLQIAKIGFQTPNILNDTFKTYILTIRRPRRGAWRVKLLEMKARFCFLRSKHRPRAFRRDVSTCQHMPAYHQNLFAPKTSKINKINIGAKKRFLKASNAQDRPQDAQDSLPNAQDKLPDAMDRPSDVLDRPPDV